MIATSSSDEKLGRLKALGADYWINYRKDENWGDSVRRLTGGRELIMYRGRGTCIIGAIHGGGTRRRSIAVIGIFPGTTATLPLHTVLTRQLRLKGLVVGTAGGRWI